MLSWVEQEKCFISSAQGHAPVLFWNYALVSGFSNAQKFPKNPMKVSSFPELERLYWEEFKRRQAMMKEMKKKVRK